MSPVGRHPFAPQRLFVGPGAGEQSHVAPVGVHHEDLVSTKAIGAESDLSRQARGHARHRRCGTQFGHRNIKGQQLAVSQGHEHRRGRRCSRRRRRPGGSGGNGIKRYRSRGACGRGDCSGHGGAVGCRGLVLRRGGVDDHKGPHNRRCGHQVGRGSRGRPETSHPLGQLYGSGGSGKDIGRGGHGSDHDGGQAGDGSDRTQRPWRGGACGGGDCCGQRRPMSRRSLVLRRRCVDDDESPANRRRGDQVARRGRGRAVSSGLQRHLCHAGGSGKDILRRGLRGDHDRGQRASGGGAQGRLRCGGGRRYSTHHIPPQFLRRPGKGPRVPRPQEQTLLAQLRAQLGDCMVERGLDEARVVHHDVVGVQDHPGDRRFPAAVTHADLRPTELAIEGQSHPQRLRGGGFGRHQAFRPRGLDPHRIPALAPLRTQSPRLAPVGIHDVELHGPIPVGPEGDLRPIGRPGGVPVLRALRAPRASEPTLDSFSQVIDPDGGLVPDLRHIGQAISAGRPSRLIVSPWVAHQLIRPSPLHTPDKDVVPLTYPPREGHPAPIRGKGLLRPPFLIQGGVGQWHDVAALGVHQAESIGAAQIALEGDAPGIVWAWADDCGLDCRHARHQGEGGQSGRIEEIDGPGNDPDCADEEQQPDRHSLPPAPGWRLGRCDLIPHRPLPPASPHSPLCRCTRSARSAPPPGRR